MKSFGTVRLERDWADCEVWKVRAEPHVIVRLKRVFERIAKNEHGEVTLANTPENCRELEWFVSRYPLTVEPHGVLEERARAFDRTLADVARVTADGYVPQPALLATPAREYQLVAADLVRANGRLLLADDVGLGKTASSICVMANDGALPALVVTLAHLTRQWEAELQKFLPGLRVHRLRKGVPYDLRKWRGKDVPFPDVIITNYHKLSGWATTLAPLVRYVIFDECQELRTGTGSQKGSAAKHVASSAAYAMGLSATPIYNYGSEIFNVIDIMAPDALGSSYEFTREWCGGADAVARPDALGTYLRERGLLLRRTRKDVGRELPEISRIPFEIEADLHPLEQVKSAAMDLARIIVSQQSKREDRFRAAGELDYRLRRATGVAKAPYAAAFVRLLAESGEKVVLYGWHHEVYGIWREQLADLKPVFYTGEESEAQKEEAKRAFVEGDARVLIVSLRAGAGLNGLQEAAQLVVFGEIDWSPGVHEQCIGRVHRDGQTNSVSAYFLVCNEGSDPVMVDVLGLKEQQSEGIRNPDAPLVEAMEQTTGRVKKLAEEYLQRLGAQTETAA